MLAVIFIFIVLELYLYNLTRDSERVTCPHQRVLVDIVGEIPFAQHPCPPWHVRESQESRQRLRHPEKAGFDGEKGGDPKESRPNKQGAVAREDATSLSLIAELSSPPKESRENGYFWKCFPSL